MVGNDGFWYCGFELTLRSFMGTETFAYILGIRKQDDCFHLRWDGKDFSVRKGENASFNEFYDSLYASLVAMFSAPISRSAECMGFASPDANVPNSRTEA